ncbi:MAG: hypothetical protein JO081_01940 [Alphaproteobacteria bacterium]|nr:hypothetical protein [Alphaproteobacteria bacterium]
MKRNNPFGRHHAAMSWTKTSNARAGGTATRSETGMRESIQLDMLLLDPELFGFFQPLLQRRDRLRLGKGLRRGPSRPQSGGTKAATHEVEPFRMPAHRATAAVVPTPASGRNSDMIPRFRLTHTYLSGYASINSQ